MSSAEYDRSIQESRLAQKPRNALRSVLVGVVYLVLFALLDLLVARYEALPGVNHWYLPAGLSLGLLLSYDPFRTWVCAAARGVLGTTVPSRRPDGGAEVPPGGSDRIGRVGIRGRREPGHDRAPPVAGGGARRLARIVGNGHRDPDAGSRGHPLRGASGEPVTEANHAPPGSSRRRRPHQPGAAARSAASRGPARRSRLGGLRAASHRSLRDLRAAVSARGVDRPEARSRRLRRERCPGVRAGRGVAAGPGRRWRIDEPAGRASR